LLHVGVCCKSFTTAVLLNGSKQIKITETNSAKWICDWLWRYGCKVMDETPSTKDLILHPVVSLASDLQQTPT